MGHRPVYLNKPKLKIKIIIIKKNIAFLRHLDRSNCSGTNNSFSVQNFSEVIYF